jgi:hypothetical protein
MQTYLAQPLRPRGNRNGCSGADERIRTSDTRIFSAVLYHLSYLGKLLGPAAAVPDQEPCRRVSGAWEAELNR